MRPTPAQRARARLRGRAARKTAAAGLNPLKLRGIDIACERLSGRSLADLGAAWGVEGGYAFYAAERLGLDRVVIVDEDLERYAALSERAASTSVVELVEGNFGDSAVAPKVGAVDIVLLFDVLLHQVSPSDWRQVLSLYATETRSFVLAGPWWTGAETIRLPELGRERYLEAVPEMEIHDELFDRIDEINPQRGIPWRDCHDVWQWGISDGDLREEMRRRGFELAHFENHGAWTYCDAQGRDRALTHFFNGLYVFTRADGTTGA